jgi:hypothetical protein
MIRYWWARFVYWLAADDLDWADDEEAWDELLVRGW